MSIDAKTRNGVDLSQPPHLRELTTEEILVNDRYRQMLTGLGRTETKMDVAAVAREFKAFLAASRRTNHIPPHLAYYLDLAEKRLYEQVGCRMAYIKSLK